MKCTIVFTTIYYPDRKVPEGRIFYEEQMTKNYIDF